LTVYAPEVLRRRLDARPRVRLAATPTALQRQPRLSRRLGVELHVKRDDLTGLAFGGNKIRQLEYFVGEALAADADVLVAGGSFAQSNHARACAAAARAAGLASMILRRPDPSGREAPATGNALVTDWLADEVRIVPELADVPRHDRLGEVAARQAAFASAGRELEAAGRRPYLLVGSSTATGVLGYVEAALELARQRREAGLRFTKVFVSSLGVTHAGLELGRRALGEPWEVVGIGYQPSDGAGASWVARLMADAAALLELEVDLEMPVVSDDRLGGPDYAAASPESRAALALAAREEALLLDPVYTAKGFAGLLRWIADGAVAPGEAVVFLHTGGLPAVFAHRDELTR
jgi:1-aminocyclopropane-1-carboxylate deaminase/D-cysteine desulfhydrase-like pyridoxal-dependent ACC family enzyme